MARFWRRDTSKRCSPSQSACSKPVIVPSSATCQVRQAPASAVVNVAAWSGETVELAVVEVAWSPVSVSEGSAASVYVPAPTAPASAAMRKERSALCFEAMAAHYSTSRATRVVSR